MLQQPEFRNLTFCHDKKVHVMRNARCRNNFAQVGASDVPEHECRHLITNLDRHTPPASVRSQFAIIWRCWQPQQRAVRPGETGSSHTSPRCNWSRLEEPDDVAEAVLFLLRRRPALFRGTAQMSKFEDSPFVFPQNRISCHR
jgi:hypothetical protein